MLKIIPSKSWQERIFASLIFVGIFAGVLGIYALRVSPSLDIDSEFFLIEHNIRKIETIDLNPFFFNQLPEFSDPEKESGWWQLQEKIYSVLKDKNIVSVKLIGKNGVDRNVEASVGFMSFTEVIKKTGLVYLVGIIYILSAVSVFRKHRSPPGLLLAFFLLSSSLYFISSAPVVSRNLTLPPIPFKILTNIIYISAGGMITLIHFALVFPKPKEILEKHPFIPYIIYGYFLLTGILYFSGTIAFGATFPFLSIWTFIMVGAFTHSLVKEKDAFLKKQISLSLLAPLMVGSIFILLYLLPGVLGSASMGLTHLALFSLILPFALSAAIDNLSLYHERIEMEKASQREKEQLRQDLHDSILADLASISISSERALKLLKENDGPIKNRLISIKEWAEEAFQQLKDFLFVTGENIDSWETLCDHLRACGYKLLEISEIEFNLSSSGTMKGLKPPGPLVRINLHYVFKEVIVNILKHSKAKEVTACFSRDENGVILEIKDDGIGFDKGKIRVGHYGLENMKKRIEKVYGKLILETSPDHGTQIIIFLPSE